MRACVLAGAAALAAPEGTIAAEAVGDCPVSESMVTGAFGGAWYHSVAPSEHFDSGRSQLFPDACSLHQIVQSDGTLDIAVREAPASYPNAYNVVTRERSELYVYGGYGGVGGAYVAKLDADTLAEQWRSTIETAAGQWSFLGAMAVLGNGDVYSIQNSVLARIDPATGAVLRSVQLPELAKPEGSGAAYNGFVTTPDGLIVAKSMERGPCTRDTTGGLSCVLDNGLPSTLVVVDPETLHVLAQVQTSEPALGRIMSERHDGIDYIYVPGLSQLVRYRYSGGVLELDAGWGPFDYDGGANAGGVGLLGDYAVTQTNYLPSTTPSRVIAANIHDGRKYVAVPFAGRTGVARLSWVPSKAALDAENNGIFVEDTYAGEIASLRMAERGLVLQWRLHGIAKGFFALTGPRNGRQLIVPMRTKEGDAVAWRDAAFGVLRQRSPAIAAQSTLSVIAPGFEGRIYYPDFSGGRLVELRPTVNTLRPD